ncbi:siderophore-interacting protein [Roseobacter sp.]|uniref:siderophore-interacting protein n=1 Tax=Roseobacter sp. TaxID=1907202 RepID=UPI00329712EA
MTIQPDLSAQTETVLYGLAYPAIRMVLRHTADARGLTVLDDSASGLSLQAKHGQYHFAARDDGIALSIRATDPSGLQTLKDGLMSQLTTAQPDLADTVRWSDTGTGGQLPANFHFVQVQSIAPLGRDFIRVRVRGTDLSSFKDGAIHFRLVLPPAGVAPVEWPHVSANGTTVWPKGDKALHRPPYTTRRINHATQELDFDVFVHEGGRVTEWARSVQPGAEIGIIGPTGGGMPDASRILIYGDETAFPAIARILEHLPQGATGQVHLFAQSGAACDYPMAAPTGLRVSWHDSTQDAALANHALTQVAQHAGHFLWFASEKSQSQQVRAAFKTTQRDSENAYIAGYWTR